MIRHFFLDKTNTIIEGKRQNFGLNPILSIGYGNGLTRGLLHFDIEPIRCLIEDKTFADLTKLKFTLKMTNCFSVAGVPYEKELIRGDLKNGKRASSCDLMLFELPCEFDEGRGFDFMNDFWVHDSKSFSIEGSTWYGPKTMIPWSPSYIENYDYKKDPGGIYTLDFLQSELDKYEEGKDSIIIGTQHFDFGDENLCIDITKYVMKCLENGYNNGLCLSFTPFYENKIREEMHYIDFFNDNTNTFFHPYVEAFYENQIIDNRDSFVLGKRNHLYLYVYDEGLPTNLDNIPKCTIEGIEFEVKQASKGVYYAIIPPNSMDMEEDAIYYDMWSEIVLNGTQIDDVEMEFVPHKLNKYITVGNLSNIKKTIKPYICGINDGEDVSRGEIKEINVEFKEMYSSDKIEIVTSAEYRLYIKDGNREIDVINFHPIEKGFLNNFFMLYTDDLIPNEYFIDVRVFSGREKSVFKNVLKFNIVSNVTERYQ